MKPMIGVIPLYDDEKDSIWMLPGYMDGISFAGGLPVILPLKADDGDIERLCSSFDGFLFTGGHDVDPEMYGDKRRDNCGPSNPDRDRLEKRIFEYALKKDIPVLGICRGIQLINVLCGGTLYQDIPTEYISENKVQHHMSPPYDVPCHEVNILENTPLFRELGVLTISVNSYHHQAVKKLSPYLLPMAVSTDGLTEALYMPGKKFIQAVQWHPEFNFHKEETSRKILQSFVNACITPPGGQ